MTITKRQKRKTVTPKHDCMSCLAVNEEHFHNNGEACTSECYQFQKCVVCGRRVLPKDCRTHVKTTFVGACRFCREEARTI